MVQELKRYSPSYKSSNLNCKVPQLDLLISSCYFYIILNCLRLLESTKYT